MSLDQLFNQFLGGQQRPQDEAQTGAGGTADSPGVAGGIGSLMNGIPGGLAGGLAAGGLMGLLAGNKKVRKTAGKVAGGVAVAGGAAALGTIAYKAYQNWQSNSNNSPPEKPGSGAASSQAMRPASVNPIPEDFNPDKATASDGQPFKLSLIKAMIAAANADGHIDAEEQQTVFSAIGKMQLEAEDKALLFDTLQNPPDVETIASFATGYEQASELYVVSRLAIDPDHPKERAYLDELARRMHLPGDLVQHLELELTTPEAQAA